MDQNISKTECVFYKSKPIDKLNVFDGITLMVDEQKKAALEVKRASKSIELAINKIYEHLTLNPMGRLIYVGAGTSGRIGVQDGVELYPTFHWPNTRLDFILAGGREALLSAVENAEDNLISAEQIVMEKKICEEDVVIGLAASGNTPFTCRVLEKAKSNNSLTLGISNNPKGKLLDHSDLKIFLDTKEEVIAGSTRLKAGTAQKICLNIISSMVMIKMGRVKNGVMNKMVPTNEKLRLRKKLINAKLL
jgi:N-acetylmuramic acid 6-phosphate etherase